MALTIDEIMNRELFGVPPTTKAPEALGHLLALGITAAPVLDEESRPLGVVSLRDLVGPGGDATVAERMSTPVLAVGGSAYINHAARLIAATGHHHVVVIDEEGIAVGFVSAIDVLRGLVGQPASHPAAFPHLDRRTGLVWSDDAVLDRTHLEAAPDGPGVLVLTHGSAGIPETVVWAEQAANVRARLRELLETPPEEVPRIAFWLERGKLRFSAAAESDPEKMRLAVSQVRARSRCTWTSPGKDLARPQR